MVSPVRKLYKRLSKVGITAQYLHNYIVPLELEQRAEHDAYAYSELVQFLVENLGVSQHSLENGMSDITLDTRRTRFFRGPVVSDLAGAESSIAAGICHVALTGFAFPPDYNGLDVQTVRSTILASGSQTVDLRSLLKFCWDKGFPVLHLSHVPSKSDRHTGTVIEIDGREAIVLSQKFRSPSKYLVPLAHELGHLANSHLKMARLLTSTEHEVRFNDETEIEAGRYATSLITGRQQTQLNNDYDSADDLADVATRLGRQIHVDPGYLILRHAGEFKDRTHGWLLGNALKIVDDGEDAIDMINEIAAARLNWSAITPINRHFLTKVTDIVPKKVPDSYITGDRFFPEYKARRLRQLMDNFHRDHISDSEKAELNSLVDAELLASIQRTEALAVR